MWFLFLWFCRLSVAPRLGLNRSSDLSCWVCFVCLYLLLAGTDKRGNPWVMVNGFPSLELFYQLDRPLRQIGSWVEKFAIFDFVLVFDSRSMVICLHARTIGV